MQEVRDDTQLVVDLYGPEMLKEYGWAAPLFARTAKGKYPRITFASLERVARLDHLRPFYRLGSHSVHAGARASDLNRAVCRQCGDHPRMGPDIHSDIAETCHGAMISLHQTQAACVGHELGLNGTHTLDFLVGHRVSEWLLEQVGDRFHAAAGRARQLGLFSHAPG